MAGGILILLGLDNSDRPFVGSYVGTGMHGGVIYLRGEFEDHQLGAEVGVKEINEEDEKTLEKLLREYAEDFQLDYEEIRSRPFKKLIPISHRPYGKLYAY
jgi:glutamate synthase domain-containing protein 3